MGKRLQRWASQTLALAQPTLKLSLENKQD